MRATLLAAALGLSLDAWSAPLESLEGTGRVSAVLGWRYTPNDYFDRTAAAAGYPSRGPSVGGPGVSASFGYAATDRLELEIELFGSFERLTFEGLGGLNSYTYGGMLGARYVRKLTPPFFPDGVLPFLRLLAGPTVVDVSGAAVPFNESLVTGVAVGAGVLFPLNERWAFNVEAKYLIARGFVPVINGGINAGGVWVGAGLTRLFPRESGPSPNDMPSLPNG